MRQAPYSGLGTNQRKILQLLSRDGRDQWFYARDIFYLINPEPGVYCSNSRYNSVLATLERLVERGLIEKRKMDKPGTSRSARRAHRRRAPPTPRHRQVNQYRLAPDIPPLPEEVEKPPPWKGSGSVRTACSNCGATLYRTPARYARSDHHFCDSECQGAWHRSSEGSAWTRTRRRQQNRGPSIERLPSGKYRIIMEKRDGTLVALGPEEVG